jgi:hypothetical protein
MATLSAIPKENSREGSFAGREGNAPIRPSNAETLNRH